MTLSKTIKKRDNSIVEFKLEKVTKAIIRAGEETGEFNTKEAESLVQDVLGLLNKAEDKKDLTVECIQDLVELTLLNSEYKATAKAYILYREKRYQERKPDIFKHRLNLKPYEYHHLNAYKEAIQHTYWLHTQYNYTSDIQDFKVKVTEKERMNDSMEKIVEERINELLDILLLAQSLGDEPWAEEIRKRLSQITQSAIST